MENYGKNSTIDPGIEIKTEILEIELETDIPSIKFQSDGISTKWPEAANAIKNELEISTDAVKEEYLSENENQMANDSTTDTRIRVKTELEIEYQHEEINIEWPKVILTRLKYPINIKNELKKNAASTNRKKSSKKAIANVKTESLLVESNFELMFNTDAVNVANAPCKIEDEADTPTNSKKRTKKKPTKQSKNKMKKLKREPIEELDTYDEFEDDENMNDDDSEDEWKPKLNTDYINKLHRGMKKGRHVWVIPENFYLDY